MKVFISWSGEKSKEVAILLDEWIKCVIQASQPWMSTNIERGALWFSEINEQLASVSLGIICLTNENKDKPWILFEAGALAKGLQTTRVCTLLIDLKNEEVEQPLAQFNHTTPDKQGMWQLINTINTQLDENRLSQSILEKVFAKNWDDFEHRFKIILDSNHLPKIKSSKRESEEILLELLNTVRSFDRRIRQIESNSVISPINNSSNFSYDTHKILNMVEEMKLSGMPQEHIVKEMLKHKWAISSNSIKRIIYDAFVENDGKIS